MTDIESIKQLLLKYGYEYKKSLGEGGFGSVFLCHSRKFNQHFAVKRAVKHRLTKNEFDTLVSLNHPNIIKIYDAFEDEHAQYLVMEYCKNGTILSKGKLTHDQFLYYSKQILDAIAYCHSNKIAHRDIKPENILLDQYENVKLADFGMAKYFEYDSLSDEKCGTIKYFAPEMFLCNEICPYKADIWALGVTFFVMATGKFPFNDISKEKLKKSILIGDFNYAHYKLDQKIQFMIKAMTQNKINSRPTAKKLLKMPIYCSLSEDTKSSNSRNRLYMSSHHESMNFDAYQNSSTDEDIKKAAIVQVHSFRCINPLIAKKQLCGRIRPRFV